MEVGQTLRAKSRAEWRRWLQKNHLAAREIWLVFQRKDSGKRHVAYADAVEEALCFGWIDSIVKPLPDGERAQRFTPRRPGSSVSELNKERIRRMIALDLMTDAGLQAAGDISSDGFKIEPGIMRAIKKDPEVWAHFQTLPDSYRRVRIGWIQEARGRPDVVEQRLRYFLKMTRAGKKFGSHQ
jgi:uncharacterized protein YdeI (YjbR/CyaY-like superfamily)